MIQNLVGAMYLLRLTIYVVYWIYLEHWLNRDKGAGRALKIGLWIFVGITLLTTTVQYFFYPNLRNLQYLGWDPHLDRAFGVFFDTAIAGAVYGLIFLDTEDLFVRLAYFVFLIFSFSRNAYLALSASVAYLFFKQKQHLKIAAFILVLLVLAFIAPKPAGEGAKLTRTFTVMARLDDYKEGLGLFLKRPVLGYGYDRLRYVRNIPVSNSGATFSSSYLTILASSGLLGFSAFAWFVVSIWKKYKNKRMLLIFVGLASLFDNIFLHPFILLLFFSFLSDR